MNLVVQGTFVSQKINKVRWIPEDYVETKCFFTGSWDDDVNTVKVWTIESPNEDDEVDYPHELSSYPVEGDVTQIKFTDKNKIAVSLSNGDVKILEVSVYDKKSPLKEVFHWKKLHNYGVESCSCTSLDTLEGDIASIGEDGNVNILSGRRGEVTRTIKEADSCSLHSVCFIKHNEYLPVSRGFYKHTIDGHNVHLDSEQIFMKCVLYLSHSSWTLFYCNTEAELSNPKLSRGFGMGIKRLGFAITGNIRGHMKIWDLRSAENTPTASFILAGNELAATCIVHHPTQPHIIIAGSESGSLAVWDLRKNTFPTSLVHAHNAGVTEMQFHPENPHKLITSSVSGDLWDWSMVSMTKIYDQGTWMPLEDGSMKVHTLGPALHKSINTFHCDKGRILYGADNEAIYLIKNYKY